ncbi:MAG: amidohydrolase family protein, partial [Alphaproteobacteria bacterium]
MLMAGPLIDGPHPFWPSLSYAVSSADQLRRYARDLKEGGVDVLKAYAGLTTEQVAALVEAARAESLDVIADLHARNGTLEVARTGIAAFGHLGLAPVTDETLSYMKDHAVATITTLAVRESFARRRFSDPERLRDLLQDPLVRETMPPPFLEELRQFAAQPLDEAARTRAATAEARLRVALANARRLSEAGVLLVAGTDAPYPGAFYGEGLHRELELLVEAGLTPVEAIGAATRNAAALVHELAEWGTLDPGKRADLLIVAGDPSRDIRATRNIEFVFQNGRAIDRASRRANPATDPGYHTSGSVAAAQVSPPAVAITHVTVIDIERGGHLPDRTVVLEGGRIAAVEAAASARVPAGAHVVDGRGKYLMPGLWDMHTHPRSEADLTQLLANGVTGTRVMWGDPATLAWKARIARGELRGPAIVTAGTILEGPPPPGLADVIATEGRALVSTAAEAIAEVRAQKLAGYDFIKVYNNLSRRAYDAIVAEARRQGMPVAGHVPFEVGLRGALAAGQASVEHLRGYEALLVPKDASQQPGADLRSRTLAWRFADAALVASLAHDTRDAGVWNTPTLSTRIYTSPPEVVRRLLGEAEAATLLRARPGIPWLSNFTAADFRFASDGHERQDQLVRALRDAGAGLLAGTDIGPWGPSLHRELQM